MAIPLTKSAVLMTWNQEDDRGTDGHASSIARRVPDLGGDRLSLNRLGGLWQMGGSDSLSGPIAIFLVLPTAFAGGAGFISRRSPNEIVLAAITSAAIALISFLVVLLIVFLTLPEGVFQ
jgi:hypothetical protein